MDAWTLSLTGVEQHCAEVYLGNWGGYIEMDMFFFLIQRDGDSGDLIAHASTWLILKSNVLLILLHCLVYTRKNLNKACFFRIIFLWIVWKKSETHQHVSPKVPFAKTACWEKYKPNLIAYRSFTEMWSFLRSFLEFSKTKKVLTFWSLTDSWHTTEPDCIINLKVMKMQMGLLREHGRFNI